MEIAVSGDVAEALGGRDESQARNPMLKWTILFLIVALIAGALGFAGLAGTAAGIARVLFVIFLVFFLVSLIRRGGG